MNQSKFKTNARSQQEAREKGARGHDWYWFQELRHDILSHFFYGVNYGLSFGKLKNNGLLRKKKTEGVILKQKGTRMAEDGED